MTLSFLWFSGVNGVTRHLVHGATVEYGFNSREQSFSRSHVSLWYGGHRWGSRMTVSRQNPRNALQRLLQPLPPAIQKGSFRPQQLVPGHCSYDLILYILLAHFGFTPTQTSHLEEQKFPEKERDTHLVT